MNNLKDFATQINAFLKGEAAQPEWFDSNCGLCANLSNYMHENYVHFTNRRVLRVKLNSLLEHWCAYESVTYPFNVNSGDYKREVEECTLYENKARLACIEGIINEQ